MKARGKSLLSKLRIAAMLIFSSPWLVALEAPAETEIEPGIILTAGQWKFDVEIMMPMQPKPSRQSIKTCVTSDPITPSALMPWAEEQGCRIRGIKVEDNRLTWRIACKANGMDSKGRGKFESKGDHAEGEASIYFQLAGNRMEIETEWDAKRLGACVADPLVPNPPPAVPQAEQ
jgi:hypothetical protein